MKKLYMLINGETGSDYVNNRCNRSGKIIIDNTPKDSFFARGTNFDEITIFNYNNNNYVCERIFINTMDFIIHGCFVKEKEKENKKIIYYKEFNGNEELDGLVENYKEIIKNKIYSAWPYSFEIKKNSKYNHNIKKKISPIDKIKNIISGIYELYKILVLGK